MSGRTRDLISKGWTYSLGALRNPAEFPRIAWQVLGQGAHAGGLIRFSHYRRWLSGMNIRTVLDVGAHRGEFASVMAALLPEATIYSFEPQADCAAVLEQWFAKCGRGRVFVMALGDQTGEVQFWRSQFTKASSALPMAELHKQSFPWTAQNTLVKVPMTTLDALATELDLSPSVLLKIDVQGLEDRVLRGARQTLAQVDYLLVETSLRPLYEGQASFAQVYQMAQEAGFEYAGNLDQLESPQDGQILQVDAFFTCET